MEKMVIYMHKRWEDTKGFRLLLFLGSQPRLILFFEDRPVMTKNYDWSGARHAEQEAEMLAMLGHMRLMEVRQWA